MSRAVRIVGGIHKGRALAAPPGRGTRPTADRARETLFNILAHAAFTDFALEGASVLDAFAGSGAVGLEALSRGAGEAFFLEKDAGAFATLRRNISGLGEDQRCHASRSDALRPPPAARAADLVFLDPPYGQGLIERALPVLLAKGWIGEDTLIAAEVAEREEISPPPGFAVLAERPSGAARFVFMKVTLPSRAC